MFSCPALSMSLSYLWWFWPLKPKRQGCYRSRRGWECWVFSRPWRCAWVSIDFLFGPQQGINKDEKGDSRTIRTVPRVYLHECSANARIFLMHVVHYLFFKSMKEEPGIEKHHNYTTIVYWGYKISSCPPATYWADFKHNGNLLSQQSYCYSHLCFRLHTTLAFSLTTHLITMGRKIFHTRHQRDLSSCERSPISKTSP